MFFNKGPAFNENDPLICSRFVDNSHLRNLKNWNEKEGCIQTQPPTIPISKQFPDDQYPKGEEIPYLGEKANRISEDEKHLNDLIHEE